PPRETFVKSGAVAMKSTPACIVSSILLATSAGAYSADSIKLDPVSAEQAKLEQEQLAKDEPRTLTEAMAEFRKTAQAVKYKSGEYELPGWLYRPKGDGPFPAILWNHVSEKEPRAQPELARFYTEHGFVFFVPIRHGHTPAPGAYIVDLQNAVRDKEQDLSLVQREHVKQHELDNHDVVAAVAWLKDQSFVDLRRIIVTSVSYGGIQTMLTAEKGLGVRGFVSFAPGAMSFANTALRERMKAAAMNAKAPLLLLQARNDYSTGPSELLGPVLSRKGPPSHCTIY